MSNGKVRKITVKIIPSGSPDVVSYNFYWVAAGNTLDLDNYDGKIDLGKPATQADGKMHIDVASLKDSSGNPIFTDGVYDIGATAVDDAGNESAMSRKLGVPFDFVVPDAPGPIEVVVI